MLMATKVRIFPKLTGIVVPLDQANVAQFMSLILSLSKEMSGVE